MWRIIPICKITVSQIIWNTIWNCMCDLGNSFKTISWKCLTLKINTTKPPQFPALLSNIAQVFTLSKVMMIWNKKRYIHNFSSLSLSRTGSNKNESVECDVKPFAIEWSILKFAYLISLQTFHLYSSFIHFKFLFLPFFLSLSLILPWINIHIHTRMKKKSMGVCVCLCACSFDIVVISAFLTRNDFFGCELWAHQNEWWHSSFSSLSFFFLSLFTNIIWCLDFPLSLNCSCEKF